MKKYTDENYDLMDENEKFAMRYGAEGRHLGDVIRDNPGKITNPDKMLEAWDKGMNMRKDGTSKVFLDDIEKKERDNLLSSKSPKTDENGIESEPVRDMWGNDLSKDSPFGNSEESGIPPEELKFDFGENENHTPKGANYLLQHDENYGKMYEENFGNNTSFGMTNSLPGESLLLFWDNPLTRAVKRILGFGVRLSKDYGSSVAQAIDEDRLKPQEEEGVIPEHFNSMGLDEGSRALEDWNREQLYGK